MIPRYTLPDMARVWAEQTKLSHWLRIEILACEGWARLGRIPQQDLEEIRTKAVAPSPERVEEIEQVTNHDVAAFVQALAEPIGPAGRWIHFGLTSSDLLDTALALQLRDAADLILDRLELLPYLPTSEFQEFRLSEFGKRRWEELKQKSWREGDNWFLAQSAIPARTSAGDGTTPGSAADLTKPLRPCEGPSRRAPPAVTLQLCATVEL